MKDIRPTDVQVNEIWGFCGMKENMAIKFNAASTFGDAWTFVGIERNTRLVIFVPRRQAHAERRQVIPWIAPRCDRRDVPFEHRWLESVLH